MRSSPSQRASSSRDLVSHKIGTESEIVSIKAEILHNQRQIERIRHHNGRLIARLAQIDGRDFPPSAPESPPTSNRAAENDQRSGGRARRVHLNRSHRGRTNWLACCSLATIFALGCGCIGFAIARALLK